MATPPLKRIASVAPIQVASTRCEFRTSAAAEICPGSPHSVKKKEVKHTKAPCGHRVRFSSSPATGFGGSSYQIKMAEMKKATPLTTYVQCEWNCTNTRPSHTKPAAPAAQMRFPRSFDGLLLLRATQFSAPDEAQCHWIAKHPSARAPCQRSPRR